MPDKVKNCGLQIADCGLRGLGEPAAPAQIPNPQSAILNPKSSFVPLRVRSNYSLLSGASSLDTLLEKASTSGIRTVALTDEGNLYGAVSFFKKARDCGIRPVLGAIIAGPECDAVLLVRNEKGYANLCRIISRKNLDPEFNFADVIPEHQNGLFILLNDASQAESLVSRLDPGRLLLELLRPTASPAAEMRLLKTAKHLGASLVASSDVFFANAGDFALHEVLLAMKTNRLLSDVQKEAAAHRENHLRPPGEMARLFNDIPEALLNTVRVAERCEFDLLGLKPVFPKLPGNSAAGLKREALEGAKRRYGRMSRKVLERIEHELDLIVRLGFPDYFLVVADIVNHARSLGTPVAGRGSGASSVVAYCLGITNVDPVRCNLPFERFLNEGRMDFPDLDIDFCWRLRDKVIDYVYKKYGDDHVAMIATYATCRPRLAFRETAKVFGLSNEVITEIAGKLRHGLPHNRWDTLPAEAGTIERILHFAERLDGFPHHLSVHCGGVVITPGEVSSRAPLQRAEKGVVITQYDKRGAEAVGLVKLDLLGNRALSCISEAARLTCKGNEAHFDPEALPDGDEKTARLLSAGDTVGVNQLESPAMRHLLKQLRPSCVRDIMQILALIRPGAASLGMKESFVRRARGLEPVPPIDPRLDGVLTETYGIMLYEDDALFVASALAGLPLQQADRFRRAVGKCTSDEERRKLSKTFLDLCRKNGTGRDIASDLWVQMAKFNSYSFCRAHAASYALLAWANAYMKAHHPAEFWVAALNNNEGMYARWVYVEEAKRSGIPVLLPCVNRSQREFSLEKGAIRIGLNLVRELSERSLDSILASRPFSGLADFLLRTEVKPGEAENLIRTGALDFCARPRPELLLQLHTDFKSASRLRKRGRLFTSPPEPASVHLPRDYSQAERWRDEWKLLGVSADEHPVTWIRRKLRRMGVQRSGVIPGRIGKRVKLAGVAAAGRTTRTSGGGKMCFLTLSDEDGLFEATFFPGAYRRHRQVVAEGGFGPFVIEGKVESQYDALTVTVNRLALCRSLRPDKRPPPRASERR